MNMKNASIGYRNRMHHQRGIVTTLIAVIVLVVSLLAAMALMRSIDTSNTIAGSLSFRQGVVQEAERAYGDAQANINFTEPTSDGNQAILGYYAMPQIAKSRPDIPDVLITHATGTVAALPPLAATGNKVFYVVERLCPAVGPASPTTCIVPGATIQGGSDSNQTKDNGPPFNSGAGAAFRLSVLVVGPRNATGYVQTIMR